MGTQHLFKIEEVETVQNTIATILNLDRDEIWLDGNVKHSVESGRRTKFPLNFHLFLHRQTTLGWLLDKMEALTGYALLYKVELETFGTDNRVTLNVVLGYDDFKHILVKASIPKIQ